MVKIYAIGKQRITVNEAISVTGIVSKHDHYVAAQCSIREYQKSPLAIKWGSTD